MISLHPFQDKAAEWLSRTARGIVKSPAGSGKTIIAAAALERLLARRVRSDKPDVVWLANTHEQCDQARSALACFPSIAARANVTIACWQSGIDLSLTPLVIADECHHFAAPVAGAMLARAPLYRWGLSATPTACDPERLRDYFGLFNKQMHTVERDQVIAGGHITEAVVHFHSASDPDFADKVNAAFPGMLQARMRAIESRLRRSAVAGEGMSREEVIEQRLTEETLNQSIYIRWQLCRKFGIEENRARNQRIVELANQSSACLILVGSIAHGKLLSAQIPRSIVCFAAMGRKARSAAVEGFKDGTLNVLIATSLADEGLDVPRASTLILACAGRSAGKVEQRTGRVLRVFKDKTCGVIHDFTDSKHPLLHSQSKSRRRLYQKLKYRFG